MAQIKLQADGLNLADTFAFSGTVTGAGGLTGVTTGSGNVTITNGNLILGTSGKGIDFSATADSGGTMTSELFDDYEEGTFTPTIGGAGSDPSVSFTSQTGNYTKIGNAVFLTIVIDVASITGGGGNFNSRGFPFTAVTWGSGPITFDQLRSNGDTGQITPFISPSTAYAQFAEMRDATDEDKTQLQVDDIGSNAHMHFTMHYMV